MSPEPRENRKGVEEPVREARQLAGQDGHPHCGDDRAGAEVQPAPDPAKNPEPHHQALGEYRRGEKRQPQSERIGLKSAMPCGTVAETALVVRIAPSTGPMQGVQPKAKAMPIR